MTDKLREQVDEILGKLRHKIDTEHYDFHFDYYNEARDQIIPLVRADTLKWLIELFRNWDRCSTNPDAFKKIYPDFDGRCVCGVIGKDDIVSYLELKSGTFSKEGG